MQFATVFCDDAAIPSKVYAETIADIIQSQIDEAQNAVEIDIIDPPITEDDVHWSDRSQRSN
jgi:hypothetical protein